MEDRNNFKKNSMMRVRFQTAEERREIIRSAELGFRAVPRFPVFHVPHAGRKFPPELMTSVCVSDETFRRYHAEMSDTEAWRLVPEAVEDHEAGR